MNEESQPRSIPFMPFYINDFYSNQGVKIMDFYERSLYIEILFACWQASDDTIPDDTYRLSRLVGIDHQEFTKLWPVVRDRFVESRPGRLTHPRIAKEKDRVIAKSKAARKNAAKRWKKKKDQEKGKAQ